MSFEPALRPQRHGVRRDAGIVGWAAPTPVAPRPELSAADAATVHRFVARRVANRADAADIAQQALLLAWTKRDTRRGENLRAWLLTIARHLIIDHYRTRNRIQFVEVDALHETEPALRTPSDAVWVVCECRARLRSWLDCITQRLHLEEQVAVLLADVHGYRDKDGAALMQMSLPSFKLLLHGTRWRLRQIAGGTCSLLRKDRPDACDGSVPGPGCRNAGCGAKGTPSVRPSYRLVVGCRLGAPKLLALRGRLLARIGLSSLVLSRPTEEVDAAHPASAPCDSDSS